MVGDSNPGASCGRTHLRGIREHFSGLFGDDQLRAVAEALGLISGPHEH